MDSVKILLKRSSPRVFFLPTKPQGLGSAHEQAVLWSIHPLQLLKVFPGIPDVDQSGCGSCKGKEIKRS